MSPVRPGVPATLVAVLRALAACTGAEQERADHARLRRTTSPSAVFESP